MYPQLTQYLSPHAIVALIGQMPLTEVGLHSVHALLLQLVSLYLVHQTYASALLNEIHHHALASLVYHLHRLVQLLSAVATLRAEDVARGTRRVHTHQHRFVFLPRALEQRDVLQTVRLLAERYQAEVAVGSRHAHLLTLLHHRFLLQSVSYQVVNRDQLHAPLVCHLAQLRQAGHRAIIVHDFHQRTSRIESSQTRQVYGSLRVPSPAQHALVLGVERIDVSRPSEGGRRR